MFAAGADALISYPQVSTDPLRRMATDKQISFAPYEQPHRRPEPRREEAGFERDHHSGLQLVHEAHLS